MSPLKRNMDLFRKKQICETYNRFKDLKVLFPFLKMRAAETIIYIYRFVKSNYL